MDYYQKITIERNIIIDSKFINKNLNENILNALKNEIEEKCIGEGYIQKDSVKILQRSIGSVLTNSFKANVSYHVNASVNVCNPPKDSILKTKVVGMNKSGILCINEPLNILVIKNLMKKDEFNNINIGDIISVKVKDKKFNLYDKTIKIIAEINNEDSKENKRKINKSNIMHNKSVKITISDNMDESEEEDSSIFSEEDEENQSLISEDDSLLDSDNEITEEETKNKKIVKKNLLNTNDEEDEEQEDEIDEEQEDEIDEEQGDEIENNEEEDDDENEEQGDEIENDEDEEDQDIEE